MRIETENAIKRKFEYFLEYKAKKTGETSYVRYVKTIRECIGEPTREILSAFLYGILSAMCYDVVAMLEARGVKLTEINKLWKEYHQQPKVKDWIGKAGTSSPCLR